MGKYEREKGKRRERWLVKELLDVDESIYRTGQYKASKDSPDVLSRDFRFSWEVKDRKRLSVFRELDKHTDRSNPLDFKPMVWYHPGLRRAVAIMDWEEFKKLLGQVFSYCEVLREAHENS